MGKFNNNNIISFDDSLNLLFPVYLHLLFHPTHSHRQGRSTEILAGILSNVREEITNVIGEMFLCVG